MQLAQWKTQIIVHAIPCRLLSQAIESNWWQKWQVGSFENGRKMTKRIVLMQALASTPEELASILSDWDEREAYPLSARAWSPRQVLAHFIDVEKRYLARLERVVAENRPAVERIDPDESAFDPQISTQVLLDQFRAARSRTLAFLKERSPEDWNRPALFESQGETDFQLLVQRLVDHDREHCNQITSWLAMEPQEERGAP